MRKSIRAAATFMVSGTIFASPAIAQTAEGEGDEREGIAEIVVTAQKRSESVQRVPITMSAFDENILVDAGIMTTRDIQNLVPGLVIDRSLGSNLTYLRGIGQQVGNSSVESPVATYVDGIYLGQPAAGVFSLNNVDRVEVLKGPQGTLYGRNATGGLVHVITKTPGPLFRLDAEAGYGRFDTWTGRAYAEGGLTDSLSLGVAFHHQRRDDGYVTNVRTGNDLYTSRDTAAQGKLVWEASPQTELTLNLIYAKARGFMGSTAGIYPGSLAADGATRYLGRRKVDLAIDTPQHSEQYVAGLKLTHDMGWALLTNIVSYVSLDHDYAFVQNGIPGRSDAPIPAPAIVVRTPASIRAWTEEFQIQSPSASRVQWVAGLFYFHDKTDVYPNVALRLDGVETQVNASTLDFFQKTTSYAAYGQATIPLGVGTRLTAGLRYTRDRRAVTGSSRAGVTPDTANLRTPIVWPKTTWRLSIDQDIGPNAILYASYNRGFKSGIYNSTSFLNQPAGPEQVDAYELGIKSQLFDRRLQANAAVFHYDYDGMQLRAAQSGMQIIFNAAKARIRGAEFDLQALLADGLTLTAGGAYLDAHYTSFPTGPISTPAPAGGNLVTFGDLSGRRLARAPEFTGNIGIRYETALRDGRVNFSLLDSYNGGYPFEADNRLRQKAYHNVSASLQYSAPDDRWHVKLWGTNILNENILGIATATASDIIVPGEPALYGITLGFKLR